jgi:hypothetical protein
MTRDGQTDVRPFRVLHVRTILRRWRFWFLVYEEDSKIFWSTYIPSGEVPVEADSR